MIHAFFVDLYGRVESMMVMKTLVLMLFNLPWSWELITLILSSRYLFHLEFEIVEEGLS